MDEEARIRAYAEEASQVLSTFILEINEVARKYDQNPFEAIRDTGCLLINEYYTLKDKYEEIMNEGDLDNE